MNKQLLEILSKTILLFYMVPLREPLGVSPEKWALENPKILNGIFKKVT